VSGSRRHTRGSDVVEFEQYV